MTVVMGEQQHRSLVQYDWPVWSRHGGITAFSHHIGLSLAETKALIAEVNPSMERISWTKVSDEALELLLGAVAKSSESVSRFASRHEYSPSGISKALAERFPERWDAVHATKIAEQSSNKYRLGADLERRVMAHLDRLGFITIRSAGSHSYVDVAAMKNGKAMLVQCKRGGILPLDEWNGLVAAADQAGAIPVMVENPHRGEVRWWTLQGPRSKGSPGNKRRLRVP